MTQITKNPRLIDPNSSSLSAELEWAQVSAPRQSHEKLRLRVADLAHKVTALISTAAAAVAFSAAPAQSTTPEGHEQKGGQVETMKLDFTREVAARRSGREISRIGISELLKDLNVPPEALAARSVAVTALGTIGVAILLEADNWNNVLLVPIDSDGQLGQATLLVDSAEGARLDRPAGIVASSGRPPLAVDVSTHYDPSDQSAWVGVGFMVENKNQQIIAELGIPNQFGRPNFPEAGRSTTINLERFEELLRIATDFKLPRVGTRFVDSLCEASARNPRAAREQLPRLPYIPGRLEKCAPGLENLRNIPELGERFSAEVTSQRELIIRDLPRPK